MRRKPLWAPRAASKNRMMSSDRSVMVTLVCDHSVKFLTLMKYQSMVKRKIDSGINIETRTGVGYKENLNLLLAAFSLSF